MPNPDNERAIVGEATMRKTLRRGHRISGRAVLVESAAAGTINSIHMRYARRAGATGRRGQRRP